MDREHNQQEMTGQEIERGSLVHVLLFPSLRVPSAWVPRLLGYLLHRPSAPPRRQDPGLWSLGDSDRPAGTPPSCCGRYAAAAGFPWQIRSLKESRQEGGEGLVPAVSGGVGGGGVSGPLSALSGAPPLLSRPVLSPAAGSVTPAHIATELQPSGGRGWSTEGDSWT